MVTSEASRAISRLLRSRGQGAQRVTNTETFFDLVYAFAITQLAKFLNADLTWHGVLQAVLLLLAVWWAWIYTAWITNWLHPDARAVRVMLLGVMLASLVVSATLPAAFGDRGLVFAITYVVMQVGRTLFMLFAVRRDAALLRNFERIITWLMVSGACWLLGGFLSGTTREAVWLVAVLVDLAAPVAGFYTPGLGRSTTTDWNIAGEHLAERCQLFMVIVFGESILDTGATLTSLPFTPARVIAFVFAFVATVALWWVYFDRSANDSSRTIASSADPGRLGRSAYTYYHLPMVTGMILTAVADERVISSPTNHGGTANTLVLLGGPFLFLIGHFLFKWAIFRRLSVPRIVAVVVLAAMVPLGAVLSPLLLGILATLVVISVVIADTVGHSQPLGGGGERR
ncbi:MAG TPA: low temperature requirement protein A [Pseudonocardiaceae bacterium]